MGPVQTEDPLAGTELTLLLVLLKTDVFILSALGWCSCSPRWRSAWFMFRPFFERIFKKKPIVKLHLSPIPGASAPIFWTDMGE